MTLPISDGAEGTHGQAGVGGRGLQESDHGGGDVAGAQEAAAALLAYGVEDAGIEDEGTSASPRP